MNRQMLEQASLYAESLAERYCLWKVGLPKTGTFLAELIPIAAAFILGAVIF